MAAPPLRQRMPVRDAVISADDGLITRAWRLFLRGQNDTLSLSPVRLGSVALNGQGVAITATPVPMIVNAGLYRVSVYARRVQVATTSSDLEVIVGFTESGVSLEVTTGVNSVNADTEVLSGSWLIRVDTQSTITYATTYASVGATAMLYRLDVIVEQVEV